MTQNTEQKSYDPDAYMAREHVSPSVADTEQNVRTRREQLSTYPESVCVGRYPGDTLQLELDGDDLDPDRLVEGPVLYVRCDIAHRSQTEAAEQRRKDAEGYLFDNPDTGTEYLPHHPIESGECQHAKNIRKATAVELLATLHDAWEGWEADRDEKKRISANVAALETEIAELKKALRHVTWTASEYGLGKIGHESAVNRARAALGSAGVSAPNPIQAMTDDQLSERLKIVQARWDELMESEEELGSGSPMESMDEEMQSLENEIARRAALTREGGVR